MVLVAARWKCGGQQGGSAAAAAESLQRGAAAVAAWLACWGGGSSCGGNLFNKSQQDPTRKRALLPCFVSFKRILIPKKEATVVHFYADLYQIANHL
jgi:hypothetical protein